MSLEMPKVPTISPVVVAQRHLGSQRPGFAAVLGDFPFDLSDHRETGAHDFLLVLESRPGVFLGKQIKVGLADDVRLPQRGTFRLTARLH